MVEEAYICGLSWAIKLTEDAVAVNDRLCHGACDKPKREIDVSSMGACEDHVRSTLMHELLHAAVYAGVGPAWPEDEEVLITGIETPWYSMFRDPRNLALFQKFTEGVFEVTLAKQKGKKHARGGKE